MGRFMISLVIPIYKNEPNLDRLLRELGALQQRLAAPMEVVFVVDGSPDRSFEILQQRLRSTPFPARLLSLSRNFGSFSAVAAGLKAGHGDYFAVLAADLQEPPELIASFHETLSQDRADVVFGVRARRADPWLSELFSRIFWWIYRALIVPDMPRGGVDVFGCTRRVRDIVTGFPESNTNLIALLFWVGFRRQYVSYERLGRQEGRSAWTVRKKMSYFLDSVFNFTELPIQLLLIVGGVGMTLAVTFGVILLVFKLAGDIHVPGYSAIVLSIMFFGALTSLGLGIVGQYLWLTLQNVRRRPNFIVASDESFSGERNILQRTAVDKTRR
jgi:glycosyltransferase involved in cell wall biosynthesis